MPLSIKAKPKLIYGVLSMIRKILTKLVHKKNHIVEWWQKENFSEYLEKLIQLYKRIKNAINKSGE